MKQRKDQAKSSSRRSCLRQSRLMGLDSRFAPLLIQRIQALQFDAGVGSGELPAYRSPRVIAHRLPLLDLLTELLQSSNIVRQALTDQYFSWTYVSAPIARQAEMVCSSAITLMIQVSEAGG